jgi:hypothetical protein
MGGTGLARFELKFSTAQYFDIFGIALKPRVHVAEATSRGSLLGQISSLKELRLLFPGPYDHDMPNPWKKAKIYMDVSEPDPFLREAYWEMSTAPCFRTVIDWILTFAFPFIKHVPNVYLRGRIKTSLRAKWEDIFATEFKFRKDNNFVGFDWEGAMAAITCQPGYATPVCHRCPAPSNICCLRLLTTMMIMIRKRIIL